MGAYRERVIVSVEAREQSHALRGAELEPLREQTQRNVRVLRVHQEASPSASNRNARALRQSRLTVGTETASTSAISCSVKPPK